MISRLARGRDLPDPGPPLPVVSVGMALSVTTPNIHTLTVTYSGCQSVSRTDKWIQQIIDL